MPTGAYRGITVRVEVYELDRATKLTIEVIIYFGIAATFARSIALISELTIKVLLLALATLPMLYLFLLVEKDARALSIRAEQAPTPPRARRSRRRLRLAIVGFIIFYGVLSIDLALVDLGMLTYLQSPPILIAGVVAITGGLALFAYGSSSMRPQ